MLEHCRELFDKDEQSNLQGLYHLLSESQTALGAELSAFLGEISLFS